MLRLVQILFQSSCFHGVGSIPGVLRRSRTVVLHGRVEGDPSSGVLAMLHLCKMCLDGSVTLRGVWDIGSVRQRYLDQDQNWNYQVRRDGTSWGKPWSRWGGDFNLPKTSVRHFVPVVGCLLLTHYVCLLLISSH